MNAHVNWSEMSTGRKTVIAVVLLVIVTVHVALFSAGGSWRTLGKLLVVVDLVSAWFMVAAVRESRKLEKPRSTDSSGSN